MVREEVKKKLQPVFEDMFKNSGVDSSLYEYMDFIDDLGMDSITFVSIIVEIENCFQIQIPDELLLMENFRNMNVAIDSIMASIKASDEVR